MVAAQRLCSAALLAALVVALGVLHAPRPAAAQELRASVDATTIAANETVTLRIEIPERVGGQPIGPEGDDFTVVGQSTSTSMQFGPQGAVSRTQLILSLRPTRVGGLTIGAVRVRTARGMLATDPIAITVTDAHRVPPPIAAPRASVSAPAVRPTQRTTRAPGTAPGAASVPTQAGVPAAPPAPASESMFAPPLPEVGRNEPFLIAHATHANAVVGEQLIVDYLLFQPRMAFGLQFSDLTEPEFGNVWYADITDARTRGRGHLGEMTHNNQRYSVALVRSYVVVPLEEGPLALPALELQVSQQTRRGTSTPTIVAAQPLLLEVAAAETANVGTFTFTAAVDRTEVRAGDAVALTLRVEGSGLMRRLALPEVPALASVRAFEPNDAATTELTREGWLTGSATRRVSFVPQETGVLTIPAITFRWFDPWTDRMEEATTLPIEVTVSGVNERAITLEEVDEAIEWMDALPPERALPEHPPAARPSIPAAAIVSAAAAPPLFLLLSAALGAWRRRQTARAPERRVERAGRDALHALDAVDVTATEAAGALLATMRDYVERRTGLPAKGATFEQLRAIATPTFGEAPADALVAWVRDTEQLRYGGGRDTAALRDRARVWITEQEAA